MTGDQIGQGIPPDGGPNGASGGRLVNRPGQTPVARERAGLDLQQRPPDAHLKGCAVNERAQRRL